MKYFLLLIVFVCTKINAQEVAGVLKEASNLEKQLKEDEALAKYKEAATLDANNINTLIKCTELSVSTGARLKDKKAKAAKYTEAYSYAQKALALNASSADANYVMSMASGSLTETEEENKKIIAYVKDVKIYADKALAINPNHAKANYSLGKWHYEMVNLNWFKKAAVKAFYGGTDKATIESAITYLEKCKSLDMYFVRNYLDLAKAYNYDNKPAKATEVLNKLIKLPNRTADDAALKAEGQKMLDDLK